MDFRTTIKNICEEKGLTQKELAQRMGITDISLNKTLRGEYPQLQTLEKIATTLGVSISELFDSPKEGIIHCPHCGKDIYLNPSIKEQSHE